MTEDTQEAIADDLGVARATVTRAVESLQSSGNLVQVDQLTTDEKREQVREFVEDSVHISHLRNLNIPSEREQKRDAVRSYIENNRDTPEPGGRFRRFYSLLLTEIQRGGVRRGSRAPVRWFVG